MNEAKEYTKMKILGSGSYGVVYRGCHNTTKQSVAMKQITEESDENEGIHYTTLREIALLKLMNHPNVVRLLDVVSDERQRLYLVFELMHADLAKQLKESALPLPQVKSFMFQLLSGIAYMHGRGIIHRDLKPQNILVNEAKQLKVGDFGLARACWTLQKRRYTHEVMTLWYRAPEILLGQREYDSSVDMWSIGVIFAEMVRREPLFDGDSEIGQLFCIFRTLGTPTEDVWPGVSSLPHYSSAFPQIQTGKLRKAVARLDVIGLDLLSKLLCYHPNDRITAEEALRHDWFADVSAAH